MSVDVGRYIIKSVGTYVSRNLKNNNIKLIKYNEVKLNIFVKTTAVSIATKNNKYLCGYPTCSVRTKVVGFHSYNYVSVVITAVSCADAHAGAKEQARAFHKVNVTITQKCFQNNLFKTHSCRFVTM